MSRIAKSVGLAMTVVSAIGLTACGSSGGNGVAADAKQTITVWAMGEEGARLQSVTKEFTKEHPNITVKVTPVGWDVVHQKLVAAAAAGKLPDMAQMGSTMMGEFISLDALEPVDTQTFDKDDFFPAAWNGNVQDGKVYGVPWYADTRALYYRTDLADKAGVTKAPTTWKEQSDLASAYQRKAGADWGTALQPGSTGAAGLAAVPLLGGRRAARQRRQARPRLPRGHQVVHGVRPLLRRRARQEEFRAR